MSTSESARGLSRRQLFSTTGKAGLLIASVGGIGGLLDACSSAATTSSKAGTGAATAAAAGTPARGGTLNAAITGHTYDSALEMVEVAREFGAFALNFQHFWFLTRRMTEAHNARWGDCFPLDYDRIGGTAAEGVSGQPVDRVGRQPDYVAAGKGVYRNIYGFSGRGVPPRGDH